jgi:hypothetical protein
VNPSGFTWTLDRRLRQRRCHGSHLQLAQEFRRGVTVRVDSGMPDFKRTGCLVLWDFNLTNCWLTQASALA